MAVYNSKFCGPVTCKVLAVYTIREYIYPIHARPIHYTQVSVPITIVVTARKNRHYTRGEILEVFAMDLFDRVISTRYGQYKYCGKQWSR